ncbi:DNA internalization-related competence protein ComEC/Rec2 [Pseudomonas sp. RIT-PI-AD]|uniref:DNA internalization-related competence protein ComEC/Rec2 n=1 Tax=Pseudomonas sp. RIT-PI-AD TaxID=3035294 RepID=UPI0021DAE264|nr:DNA internalization-related competence protein ComEC/Rec2 [Pseudomonas sp. RIT-PI-AD]
MRLALLGLAAGLLLLRCLPALPPGWVLAALAVSASLLLPSRGYPLALAMLGFCWACLSAQQALDDRLPAELDGRILWLQGQVVGLPEWEEGTVRFQLEEADSRRARLPARLRLSWQNAPPLEAGERWRLAVKLKRPRGLVNPQAFDYDAWLLAQRIGATGSVKAGERLQAAQGLAAWRDRVRGRLLASPAMGREGALAALILGDGSGLSPADWRLLQDTGTVHLLVISGQHIVMLAGLLYALVAWLARHGAWPRRWPWLPFACALAFAGASGYGLLAGFDVPVRRACLMVAVVLIWRLRFRPLGVWTPLLLALCGVLLGEPLASLQPGFWLSFAAMALLAWTFSGRLGAWGPWRTWWRAQWLLALGLMPLLGWLGLPLSLSGPAANLLAVPWVSLVSVPLGLAGMLCLPIPYLGDGLLWLAGASLAALFAVLGWIAPWLPAWLPVALPFWSWLLAGIGVSVLLLPGGVPFRALGGLLLLPLFFPVLQRPAESRADVWMLDVGQGLSVLVRTRDHSLLYDAAPRQGAFDLGDRVVLPSLRALGLARLDLMLLSHADNDHAGGALAVQRGMPVERVLSGEAPLLPAALHAQPCTEERWEWNGVRFATWRWPLARTGNDASCVLSVEANGERLLLTGDIGTAAEAAWLATPGDHRVDWLLAPHHGSRSSSSTALLRATSPKAVLISRGWSNAFGHPHPVVLQRYRAQGAQILDSAESGAIRLRLGDYRQASNLRDQARFWREK